eukprot:383246-Pyramimonas_sp.AAC.1
MATLFGTDRSRGTASLALKGAGPSRPSTIHWPRQRSWRPRTTSARARHTAREAPGTPKLACAT